MVQKTYNLVIYTSCVSLPVTLIQCYILNSQLLPQLLIAAIIFIILLVFIFIYGLSHKKRANILSLPLFILTFILFFKIVQYQDKKSAKTAEHLIVLIEKYKKDHKKYPTSLVQLEGSYIRKIPKISQGLFRTDYLYSFDKKNNTFSLTKEFGKYGGKTWNSTMGSWDYYGD